MHSATEHDYRSMAKRTLNPVININPTEYFDFKLNVCVENVINCVNYRFITFSLIGANDMDKIIQC
jgi:hypothetical protein